MDMESLDKLVLVPQALEIIGTAETAGESPPQAQKSGDATNVPIQPRATENCAPEAPAPMTPGAVGADKTTTDLSAVETQREADAGTVETPAAEGFDPIIGRGAAKGGDGGADLGQQGATGAQIDATGDAGMNLPADPAAAAVVVDPATDGLLACNITEVPGGTVANLPARNSTGADGDSTEPKVPIKRDIPAATGTDSTVPTEVIDPASENPPPLPELDDANDSSGQVLAIDSSSSDAGDPMASGASGRSVTFQSGAFKEAHPIDSKRKPVRKAARAVHCSSPINVHVDGASPSDDCAEAPPTWIERIPIDRLEFDAQVREICQFRVIEYDQDMGRGAKFPPLEVHTCIDAAGVRHYYLVGGFHRLSAYVARRHKYVECVVTEGDLRAAKWAAAASNIAHGIRRNDEDKRRAVWLLLEDDEWRQMTDRPIAAYVKVSPTFVGNMRREYDRKHGIGPDRVTTRKSSDGRTFTFGGNAATPATDTDKAAEETAQVESAPPAKRPSRKARVPLKFGRTKPGPGLAPAIPSADHKPEEVPSTPKEMPQATDQQKESPEEAEAAYAAGSGDALTLRLQDLRREGVPFAAILATIKRIWDVL